MSSTVPLWVAVLLSLVPSLVAIVAVLAAEVRERRRLKHEQEMQRLQINEHRASKLQEERLRAYSTFARLTKTVDADNPAPGKALAEAHSEIEMLTDNPNLTTAAVLLLNTWGEAWEYARGVIEEGKKDPYRTQEYQAWRAEIEDQRTTFLRLARDEVRELD